MAHNQGDNQTARAYLREALDIFRQRDEPRGIATVLNNLGWVACELSDLETGRTLTEEALELNRALGDIRGIAVALNNLGWVANYRGEYVVAAGLLEESLALRRQLGDHRNIGFALSNLAWAETGRGAFDRATALADEAIALLESLDDLLIFWARLQRLETDVARGDLEQADGLVAEVTRVGQVIDNPSLPAWALGLGAEAALARGETDRAAKLAAEAGAIWRSIGTLWGTEWARSIDSKVALARGEIELAAERFSACLAGRLAFGARAGSADCLEGLAAVQAARGAAESAVRLLAAAATERRAIGAVPRAHDRATGGALVEKLREQLGAPRFETAWSQGQARPVATVAVEEGFTLPSPDDADAPSGETNASAATGDANAGAESGANSAAPVADRVAPFVRATASAGASAAVPPAHSRPADTGSPRRAVAGRDDGAGPRGRSGDHQLGSYELIEPLGHGGMAEVWRARHVHLDRPAAVKLFRPGSWGAVGGDERAALLARFEREARATAALRSTHTIQIHDYGHTATGTLYYAMELLEGLDLDALVERHGPVEACRTRHILLGVCESLAEAHHRGLVHRDIKPANVFLARVGLRHDVVKVLDFGLVRSLEADAPMTRMTLDGRVAGTPAFMPPEAMRDDSQVDARGDIYSVGCLAYWLLTGRLVFETETVLQMMLAHLERRPRPPSADSELTVPAALDALVLACLEKRPEDRPTTVRELAARLRDCPGVAPWAEVDAERWWRRHRPETV
jgi:tRNA A-37 threonylcarbamoyl transferase component Bud32